MGPCTRAQIPNEKNKQVILHVRGHNLISPFTLAENAVQGQTKGFSEN